jgi:hypothetical protein
MPAARTTFEQAVAITPPERNLPAGSRLTFSGQDVNWTSGSSSGTIKLTNGQIITVDGSATITGGTFEGRASLFVRDSVTIQDSLTYTSALRDGAGNPTGSVLGINAGGDIVLRSQAKSKPAAGCGAVPSSSAFELDAILISLGGTVFADGMQRVLSASECAQVLRLRGAVATKYQGVYGLYDAGTGDALAGFTKDFSHDDRAVQDLSFLPPYLVTPSGLQWVRLDLGEVYCESSTGTCS